MNTGRVNIIMAAAVLVVLGGCTTSGSYGYKSGQPILSAADAKSMISVEVRELEPLPVDEAVAAASSRVR